MTILVLYYDDDGGYGEKSSRRPNREDITADDRSLVRYESDASGTRLILYYCHDYIIFISYLRQWYSRVVDERHTETSRRKLNMVNVAARCRLCDDPPPPPPCRLTASSDSAVRLRPVSENTNTLIH